MTPAELRSLQRRTRLAVQRHRHPPDEENIDEGCYKYGNIAALKKAKSRVLKSLPASPRKRKTVLKSLACEILNAYVIEPRTSSIPQETIDKVISFDQDDSVSRMMPEKADYISIRDENSNKVHKQKRHLVMTIAKTYQCFAAENPEEKIGKSSLRPKWVLLCSEMPQNVCGCKYHKNVILLLDSPHKKFPDVMPLYSKQAYVCLTAVRPAQMGNFLLKILHTKSQKQMNLNGINESTRSVLFKRIE